MEGYLYLVIGIVILIIILLILKYKSKSKSSCVICLCARDVEPYLDNIFINLQKLNTLFYKTQVIFFYDTSNDNTLDTLRRYQDTLDNIHIIENKEPLLEYRTHRISNGRNRLLDYMNTNFNDYEYFIIMDCDDVCSNPIKTDVLAEYLDRNDWDSLSFNRKGNSSIDSGHYYDIWALQYEPFYWDCWGYGPNSVKVLEFMKKDITKKLNKLDDDELFTCISAFNGFAIYRKDKFKNIRYNGVRKNEISKNEYSKLKTKLEIIGIYNSKLSNLTSWNTPETCEHIDFHKDAIQYNNAKIKISKKNIF
tara:strand:- start:743 stop:1663 length:921 start_codon:yes stop_codon:yes gene_type:complete